MHNKNQSYCSYSQLKKGASLHSWEWRKTALNLRENIFSFFLSQFVLHDVLLMSAYYTLHSVKNMGSCTTDISFVSISVDLKGAVEQCFYQQVTVLFGLWTRVHIQHDSHPATDVTPCCWLTVSLGSVPTNVEMHQQRFEQSRIGNAIKNCLGICFMRWEMHPKNQSDPKDAHKAFRLETLNVNRAPPITLKSCILINKGSKPLLQRRDGAKVLGQSKGSFWETNNQTSTPTLHSKLARCEEEWIYDYAAVSTLCTTTRKSSRRDCPEVCALIAICENHSRLQRYIKSTELFLGDRGGSGMQPGGRYDSRLFAPPSSVAIQNRQKHFFLQTWLDNMVKELICFKHTEPLNIHLVSQHVIWPQSQFSARLWRYINGIISVLLKHGFERQLWISKHFQAQPPRIKTHLLF